MVKMAGTSHPRGGVTRGHGRFFAVGEGDGHYVIDQGVIVLGGRGALRSSGGKSIIW